jgi:thiamine phosphate synthase YjbQ (UPF0047 family)
MNAQSLTLRCRSARAPEFVDITDDVCHAVAESTIRNGLVTVFSRDAATAVKINEHEPLLLDDLERLLADLGALGAAGAEHGPPTGTESGTSSAPSLGAPASGSPTSTATRLRPLRPQTLLGSSETIPLVDGHLQFGRWQRLFLIELDRPGTREVIVQIVGA